MGSWIEDFNSYQSQTEGSPIRLSKGPQTKKEKIEAELKLLQWHKLANEAAIKTALMQNKALKEQRPASKPHFTSDDSRWMRKVIDEEHTKPLEVSRDFVINLENRETENSERLAKHVESHIGTLKNLRHRLEAKNEAKTRSDEYRQWQRGFSAKKNAIMLGKTLSEIADSNVFDGEQEDIPMTEDDIADREIAQYSQARHEYNMKQASSNELSNVLDSLNKLAELEKRISHLETDNKYDQLLQQEQTPAFARAPMEFQKKRAPMGTGGPVGIVYALKNKSGQVATGGMTRRTGGPTAGRSQNKGNNINSNNNNNGFFLTEFGQDDNANASFEDDRDENMENQENIAELRNQAKRERQRQVALASSGQKNLRNRIQTKKARQKEQSIGAKRHEDAMKELARRRQEQQKPRNIKAEVKASKGASSGVRNKNKHLQELDNIKKGHNKRREDLMRNNNRAAPQAVSKTAPARVNPSIHNNNNSNNNNNNNNNNNPNAIGNNRGRQVKSSTAGMTRRTDKPTKRGVLPAIGNNNNNNNNMMMNNNNNRNNAMGGGGGGPIAVAGVGGLRAIREMKGNR